MKTIPYVFVSGILLAAGCANQNTASAPAQMLCRDGTTTAAVMEAADDVLSRMHFSIEKLDPEHGVIRTRPLRAGQIFEFWRSENVGPFNSAEANLQTIRRSVELRVKKQAADRGPEAGGASRLQPAAAGLCIECDVSVQRLSLPGNEIASVSQAYRIHSRSEPTVQRLAVTPEQEQGMAWVDLGRDPQLAAEILQRVAQRLEALD